MHINWTHWEFWVTIGLAIYYVIAFFAIIRIIIDTRTPAKTLSYILMVIILPLIGVAFYFFFGVNYRKKKIYKRKSKADVRFFEKIKHVIIKHTRVSLREDPHQIDGNRHLATLIAKDSMAPLTANNKVELLLNGEQKFPEVIKAMEAAKQHIHIEYYIVEDDVIGHQIKQLMIKKAKEGVAVRFIYDDFGSSDIKRRYVRELRSNGVQVFPFYKIYFSFFASRLNYRDHRKIIVIDGKVGFVGGINISDRYINNGTDQVYWRDTHLKITGFGVQGLQYHFIANWNFCAKEELPLNNQFFPDSSDAGDNDLVQISASGPSSPRSSIMLSNFAAITAARQKLYITTPYFIPNEPIFEGIVKAALSGVDVRLLVPDISDSRIVSAASKSYYQELLEAGVRIFQYQKGFIHSKTMVVDDSLSIVGTANMDIRSFDLNFEINAVVYSKRINGELTRAFIHDLEDSEEVLLKNWYKRNKWVILLQAIARLLSSVL